MISKFAVFAVALIFTIRPVDAQRAIDVDEVVLDKETAFTVCPMGDFPPHRSCNKDAATVRVRTISRVLKVQEAADFYYIPGAGQIIGKGREVFWDLSDTEPGTYSITVGIGVGGVIRGRVLTKTVNLVECPACHPPCVCPSLKIVGPSASVLPGDLFVVRAEVSGGDKRDLRRYRWTVTGGEIVNGEKETNVLIRARTETVGQPIEVTFDLGGPIHDACGCGTQAKISIALSKR